MPNHPKPSHLSTRELRKLRAEINAELNARKSSRGRPSEEDRVTALCEAILARWRKENPGQRITIGKFRQRIGVEFPISYGESSPHNDTLTRHLKSWMERNLTLEDAPLSYCRSPENQKALEALARFFCLLNVAGSHAPALLKWARSLPPGTTLKTIDRTTFPRTLAKKILKSANIAWADLAKTHSKSK